jgi:hypothetical protein
VGLKPPAPSIIRRTPMSENKLANSLGWFSLGLGLAEVITPHTFTRAFYTRNRFAVVRTAYGLREIAAGLGILTQRDPTPWIWARIAGDALDLATLGLAYSPEKPEAQRRNIGLALAAVAGVTALDVVCAARLRRG